MQPTSVSIDDLKCFPFINEATILLNFKSELSSYLAESAGVSPDMDILEWWKPHWSNAVRDVMLVQPKLPSSAVAERAFLSSNLILDLSKTMLPVITNDTIQ